MAGPFILQTLEIDLGEVRRAQAMTSECVQRPRVRSTVSPACEKSPCLTRHNHRPAAALKRPAGLHPLSNT